MKGDYVEILLPEGSTASLSVEVGGRRIVEHRRASRAKGNTSVWIDFAEMTRTNRATGRSLSVREDQLACIIRRPAEEKRP